MNGETFHVWNTNELTILELRGGWCRLDATRNLQQTKISDPSLYKLGSVRCKFHSVSEEESAARYTTKLQIVLNVNRTIYNNYRREDRYAISHLKRGSIQMD